jgi:hypothetical protein
MRAHRGRPMLYTRQQQPASQDTAAPSLLPPHYRGTGFRTAMQRAPTHTRQRHPRTVAANPAPEDRTPPE